MASANVPPSTGSPYAIRQKAVVEHRAARHVKIYDHEERDEGEQRRPEADEERQP